MTLSPDDDFAAAEFALGTLEPGERAALAARRRREPELDAAIRAWEARLSPLAEATPPIAPPGRLPAGDRGAHPRRRGAARLAERRRGAASGAWRAGGRRRSPRRASRRCWRSASSRARRRARQRQREFVAVLQKSADSPAFVASVNLDSGELTVRPLAAPPQTGKSYELWIIEPKLGAPRSLGVLDAAAVDSQSPARRL